MEKYRKSNNLESIKVSLRYAGLLILIGISWIILKSQYLAKYNPEDFDYKKIDLLLSFIYIIISSALICILYYRRTEKTRIVNNELIDSLQQIELIDEEKKLNEENMEKKLRHLAYYDDLTGLPNKHLLRKHLDEQLEKNSQFSILYIEIDDYKLTNESLGHEESEDLLKKVSNILFFNLDKDDYLARISENEFIIVVDNNINKKELENKTKKILNEIIIPIHINKSEIYLSSRIGISSYEDGEGSTDELIKEAHLALHHIKYDSEYYYAFFNDEVGKRINRKNYIITELEKSIKEKSFIPYFQPISNIENNKVVGLETLIRWIHPEEGFISPGEFIPIAEETGQIFRITDIILEKAFKQKQKWNIKGFKSFVLSINISSKSFQQRNLELKILELLGRYELEPEEIILEITETAAIKNANIDEIKNSFSRFKGMGIEIALDDFGTGSSSLSRLNDWPIKYIKLDESFIRNIVSCKKEEAVVKTIIDLSKILGLNIIAEGIETSEQKDILLDMGCRVGQGYYLARPAAAEEIEKLF